MKSVTMPMPIWGELQTQQIVHYPLPGNLTSSTSPYATAPSRPAPRSSSCGAGTHAPAMVCQISPQQKRLSGPLPGSCRVGSRISMPTTHSCSMANEFKEPEATTYGHNKLSAIKETVPTTFSSRANSLSTTWTSLTPGKDMIRTCPRPIISDLPGSLSVAAGREASQTKCKHDKVNEIKEPVPVTHYVEFHDPVPTTYETNKVSKYQARVQTICESDEARELIEPVPTTYGCNMTNGCTEAVPMFRTNSHANDLKEPMRSKFTEPGPKPGTCSNANDFKEPVPTTFHSNKTNEVAETVAKLRTCSNANDFEEPLPKTYGCMFRSASDFEEPLPTTYGCTFRSNNSNEVAETLAKLRTCSSASDFEEPLPTTYECMKVDDEEEVSDKRQNLVSETINHGLADTTLASKANHDDGDAASGTNKTLVVESSPALNSSKCRAAIQVTLPCNLQSPRLGSQAASPSKKLSLGRGGGGPSRTLNSGLGGSTLLCISSPRPSTNQVVIKESVPTPTTLSCNMAKAFKEPMPTTYGRNKSAESEVKAPVSTTSGCNMAKQLREPVPTIYGHNKAVESQIKAPVPTSYGKKMAKDPKEPVPTTYGHSKAVESEIEAPVPTTYGYNKAFEFKTKAPVPTTYGCTKANELRSGAKIRLASLKSSNYNGKRGVIVGFDRSGFWHVKLEDGEEIAAKSENLVIETVNHGHPNSVPRRSSTNQIVPDATRAVWQQSTPALSRTMSANLPEQVALNFSCFNASPGAVRAPRAAQPSMIGQLPPVKLVVFDFDCTLTVFHVFASLGDGFSDWKLLVPAPHARTERGQLQRLAELDAHPDWGPSDFAFKAFGGKVRVARLRTALEALARKGVECIVCSRGLVGPIRKCLDQVNLLTLFSHTLGNLGNRFGTSSYDEAAARTTGAEHYLGTMDMDVGAAGAASKAEAITNCITTRGLKCCQVIFLDDDINEVKSSSVQAIHVAGGNGIGVAELQLLRGMADADGSCEGGTPGVPTPSTSAWGVTPRGTTTTSSRCEEDSVG